MKQYRVRINGRDYDVAIGQVSGKTAEVSVNGTPYEVEIEETTAAAQAGAVSAAADQTAGGATATGQTAGPAADLKAGTSVSASQHTSAHEPHRHPHHQGDNDPDARDVVSPLPGVILGIYVGIGEKVRKGQKVAVLEAMKMENEIEADADGTISAIHVQKNDSVLEGARIVTIIR